MSRFVHRTNPRTTRLAESLFSGKSPHRGRSLRLVPGILVALSTAGCGVAPTFVLGLAPTLSDVAREIEEADIVKLQDGFLYVANPYTGLRVIDVGDISQPVIRGSVPLGGRAVELFIQDGFAFVLTAADFLNCAGRDIGFAQTLLDPALTPDYDGSRLWVVDVSDPDAPGVSTTFDFDGFVKATRRVGHVIYASGNTVIAPDEGDDQNDVTLFSRAAFVTSINVADPTNAFLVETEVFPGRALDVYVSENTMLVFGNDSTVFDTSVITYVDISDPDGNIEPRDQIRVPGTVADRFSIDIHEGALRVITDQYIPSVFSRVVALFTYDVTDPDDITRLARLPVSVDRGLAAARLDGPRGYAETTRSDSPLLVLDLSDPTAPRVAGELTTPGVGTQLTPLGDRLIAVGFDTSAGVRPAIALYDVSDASNPRRLDRVIVGERFTFDTRSTATVDEKALRVIEEAGLILLPYSVFDNETGLFTDAIQFIELGDADLSERGTIEHTGFVRRADILDERVWILSDRAFQTVDVDDLDDPVSLAAVEFIGEQELLDAGLSGCADSARSLSTRISPAVSPGLCGILGGLSMITAFIGLVALRFTCKARFPVSRGRSAPRRHSARGNSTQP